MIHPAQGVLKRMNNTKSVKKKLKHDSKITIKWN